MKLATHVQLGRTYKKVHGSHSPNPTGSRPFWIERPILTPFWLFTDIAFDQTPPRDFDRLASNSVRSFIRHGQFKVIKTVSFPACWRGHTRGQISPSLKETQNCYNSYMKADRRTKLLVIDHHRVPYKTQWSNDDINEATPPQNKKCHVLLWTVSIWPLWPNQDETLSTDRKHVDVLQIPTSFVFDGVGGCGGVAKWPLTLCPYVWL